MKRILIPFPFFSLIKLKTFDALLHLEYLLGNQPAIPFQTGIPLVTCLYVASARLTALFTDLLERQFPLATPQQTLRLRTPTDYADQLAVHVNHLNRVLKDMTGHTTTALIGNRVAQEAKLLLKQTSWSVSEIGDCLGFADVAHFCHFFKRQTGLVPGAFRE